MEAGAVAGCAAGYRVLLCIDGNSAIRNFDCVRYIGAPRFFFGGGCALFDPEALYNLCLILKTVV